MTKEDFFRRTNILEKALASLVNVIIVFLITLPFSFYMNILNWKFLTIGVFYVYSLYFHYFGGNRCIGMKAVKTHWESKYDRKQFFVYSLLYTLSFSTLLFSVFFPFDLFILNVLVQLTFIVMTGTTLHGYLSGDMHTVKKHRK